MSHLKDKVILITGGTSGIGEACTEYFARLGARVVAMSIPEPSLFFSPGANQSGRCRSPETMLRSSCPPHCGQSEPAAVVTPKRQPRTSNPRTATPKEFIDDLAGKDWVGGRGGNQRGLGVKQGDLPAGLARSGSAGKGLLNGNRTCQGNQDPDAI